MEFTTHKLTQSHNLTAPARLSMRARFGQCHWSKPHKQEPRRMKKQTGSAHTTDAARVSNSTPCPEALCPPSRWELASSWLKHALHKANKTLKPRLSNGRRPKTKPRRFRPLVLAERPRRTATPCWRLGKKKGWWFFLMGKHDWLFLLGGELADSQKYQKKKKKVEGQTKEQTSQVATTVARQGTTHYAPDLLNNSDLLVQQREARPNLHLTRGIFALKLPTLHESKAQNSPHQPPPACIPPRRSRDPRCPPLESSSSGAPQGPSKPQSFDTGKSSTLESASHKFQKNKKILCRDPYMHLNIAL